MDRFQPLDVSNSSIGAHLYPSEEVLLLTPGVGMYSGPLKSLPHASGTMYLTSHRMFYIDDAEPHKHSCFVALSLVRETQFFAGFLKSSPKIKVGFRAREEQPQQEGVVLDGAATANSTDGTVARRPSGDWRTHASATDASASQLPTSSWVCRVCAFSNTLDPGADHSASVKCSLCGVATDVKDVALQQSSQAASKQTAAPTNNGKVNTPAPKSADGVACPTCTFHNHPSMLRCEMCDASLATESINTNGTPAATSTTPSRAATPIATTSKTPEPLNRTDLHNHVRLSFRKGGDRPFYDTLKTTLKEKRWQRSSGGSGDTTHARAQGNGQRSGHSTPSRRRFVGGAHANIDGRSAAAHSDDDTAASGKPSTRRVGIEGIMSAVDLQSREESSDMNDALRDLEALMMRAKKMVDFAEALNAKLNRQESGGAGAAKDGGGGGGGDDEAATMIRSSLVRLGLPTPAITSDMARDQHEFNVQLARELAGLLYASRRPLLGRGKVLTTPMAIADTTTLMSQDAAALADAAASSAREGLGILPLDEVWCLWNRARGVALVSPKELLAVLPLLPRLSVPAIVCKTFASGVKVLHTPRFAERNLSARVCRELHARQRVDNDDEAGETPATGLSTLDLARIEACPLNLMSELLSDVERTQGVIVRDEYGGQVVWYINRITSPPQLAA